MKLSEIKSNKLYVARLYEDEYYLARKDKRTIMVALTFDPFPSILHYAEYANDDPTMLNNYNGFEFYPTVEEK